MKLEELSILPAGTSLWLRISKDAMEYGMVTQRGVHCQIMWESGTESCIDCSNVNWHSFVDHIFIKEGDDAPQSKEEQGRDEESSTENWDGLSGGDSRFIEFA